MLTVSGPQPWQGWRRVPGPGPGPLSWALHICIMPTIFHCWAFAFAVPSAPNAFPVWKAPASASESQLSAPRSL